MTTLDLPPPPSPPTWPQSPPVLMLPRIRAPSLSIPPWAGLRFAQQHCTRGCASCTAALYARVSAGVHFAQQHCTRGCAFCTAALCAWVCVLRGSIVRVSVRGCVLRGSIVRVSVRWHFPCSSLPVLMCCFTTPTPPPPFIPRPHPDLPAARIFPHHLMHRWLVYGNGASMRASDQQCPCVPLTNSVHACL